MRITAELVRKKSEHHAGSLGELEEISLHQLQLERLEVIDRVCPKLRILYLHNNLIPTIENVRRLKSLEYLNLTINNIERVENLESCEKLRKLDLTLNFVDIDALEASIESLKHNVHLTDLYLTGNPCTKFDGYRNYVIATLVQLKALDGDDITPTHRLAATQQLPSILKRLRSAAESRGQMRQQEKQKPLLTSEEKVAEGVPYTPAARLEQFREDQERKLKQDEEDEARKRERQPVDVMKEVDKKLNQKVVLAPGDEGTIPSQRNRGKMEFDGPSEDAQGHLVYVIKVPRFLDTSLIDVDVHPQWFQCIVKGSNLLLHTPEEVLPGKTRLVRVTSNGWLRIIMPRAMTPELYAARGARAATRQLTAAAEAEADGKGNDDPDQEATHVADYSVQREPTHNRVSGSGGAPVKKTAPIVNFTNINQTRRAATSNGAVRATWNSAVEDAKFERRGRDVPDLGAAPSTTASAAGASAQQLAQLSCRRVGPPPASAVQPEVASVAAAPAQPNPKHQAAAPLAVDEDDDGDGPPPLEPIGVGGGFR